jgi:rare lipoprotein A
VKLANATLALVATSIALVASAATAAADPAPIEYAANTSGDVFRPQVSAEDGALVGGDARSYGYGAPRRSSQGAVIDIRRPTAATAVTPADPDQTAAPASQAASNSGQGRPDWLETERVGPPYQANGRWYVPTPEPGYSVNGTASWYGPSFHGQRGANGEVYDQEAMTAAHPTLPLNSLVQVTNLDNGREVIVRVTDRGPFVGDRVIDLSHAAAHVLGYDTSGTAHVNVRYLGPAPRRVNADGSLAERDTPAQSVVSVAASGEATAQAPAASSSADAGAPVSLAPAPAAQTPAQTRVETGSALAGAPNAAPGGGYFVQVGAFSSVDNAHHVRDAIAATGPVVLDTRRSAAGMDLFRVRLGPYQTRDQAEAAQHTLSSMGYAQSVVAGP